MFNFLLDLAPLLTNILLIAGLVGGVFIFANTRKMAVIDIQSKTVKALQDQIDAIQNQQTAMLKENERLKYVIEAITAALKHKGIIVSVDGEMVTLTESHTSSRSSTTMRKRPKQTTEDKTDKADAS